LFYVTFAMIALTKEANALRRSGEIMLFGLIFFFAVILVSFMGVFSVPISFVLGLLGVAVLVTLSGYGLSKFEDRFS